jgi:hypothetical protein
MNPATPSFVFPNRPRNRKLRRDQSRRPPHPIMENGWLRPEPC